MINIYTNYCSGNNAVANMLTIYIEEAHAIDEWNLPDSEIIQNGEVNDITVHKNIHERISVAKRFIKNRNIKCNVVCDSMKGDIVDSYGAWPERLYIIMNGVIVYQGGLGPFDYKLGEVQDWLGERYGKRGESVWKK
jgi:hypothetical protein